MRVFYLIAAAGFLSIFLYFLFKSPNPRKKSSSNKPTSIEDNKSIKLKPKNINNKPTQVDNTISRQWVNAHNKRRERRGLNPLTWDDTLASQAQVVARKIETTNNLTHSDLNQPNCVNGRCGQNISYGLNNIDRIVSSWIDCECPNFDGMPQDDSGHYSQAMWPIDSLKVGCATSGNLSVCNYNTGNITSQGNFTKNVPKGNCIPTPSFCKDGQYR